MEVKGRDSVIFFQDEAEGINKISETYVSMIVLIAKCECYVLFKTYLMSWWNLNVT